MKQKNPIETETETLRLWTRPVSYRWSLPDTPKHAFLAKTSSIWYNYIKGG